RLPQETGYMVAIPARFFTEKHCDLWERPYMYLQRLYDLSIIIAQRIISNLERCYTLQKSISPLLSQFLPQFIYN
ncbi:hypothetical protein LF927_21755, partial [Pectobacterium polaris]|uniref:hypothetical protein n=1 Tax=Pectobacterium polaris TaxID=2042057 RepID=UPI001CF2BF8C